MRKFLCALCTVTLLLSCGVGALAAEAAPEVTSAEAESVEVTSAEAAPVEEASAAANGPEIIVGEITAEDEEKGQITVQGIDDEEYVVVLNVTPETVIVDAVTGMSAGLAGRESELVKVYYGPTQTMSMPPISNALIVAVNRPEIQMNPNYSVVEAVEIRDGIAYVTTNGGADIVSISSDATVLPYLTKDIVTIEDIKVGTELLLWDEVTLLSYPSQSTSDIAVILSTPSEEPVAEEPAAEEESVVEEPTAEEAPVVEEPAAEEAPVVEEPVIEEAPVAITMATQPVILDGVEMYPVRRELEAMGGGISLHISQDPAVGVVIVYGEDSAIVSPDGTVRENGYEAGLSNPPVTVDGELLAVKEFFKVFKDFK